jgi:hypothetical protein
VRHTDRIGDRLGDLGFLAYGNGTGLNGNYGIGDQGEPDDLGLL